MDIEMVDLREAILLLWPLSYFVVLTYGTRLAHMYYL